MNKDAVKTEAADAAKNADYDCGKGIGLAKMSRKELENYRQKLRDALPRLTPKEIRRHRMSFFSAICCELTEDGYDAATELIKDLVAESERRHEAAGSDSVMWDWPQLKDHNEYLKALVEALRSVESLSRHDEKCRVILSLAIKFMRDEECWWWIASRMFQHCLKIVENFVADGGKQEAIVRYIYGRFLFLQLNCVEDAALQLQLSHNLCTGLEWSAAETLGEEEQGRLHLEVCKHLYKALLLLARESGLNKKAVRLCTLALRRAEETESTPARAECLLELGKYQQDAEEYAAAAQALGPAIELFEELLDYDRACEAHLHMAICSDQTMEHLAKVKIIAEKHNMRERQAEAERFMGEYNMSAGNYVDARSHFLQSLSIYFSLGPSKELEEVRLFFREITNMEVRALECLSMGQQLMPSYCNLVKRANDNYKDMIKLIKWKDGHVPFDDVSQTSSGGTVVSRHSDKLTLAQWRAMTQESMVKPKAYKTSPTRLKQ